MDAIGKADAFLRTARGIIEGDLRASYVRSVLLESDVAELAAMLEIVCARAEQAEHAAREVLVALAFALADPAVSHVVARLREEAKAVPHLALERLVRHPVSV